VSLAEYVLIESNEQWWTRRLYLYVVVRSSLTNLDWHQRKLGILYLYKTWSKFSLLTMCLAWIVRCRSEKLIEWQILTSVCICSRLPVYRRVRMHRVSIVCIYLLLIPWKYELRVYQIIRNVFVSIRHKVSDETNDHIMFELMHRIIWLWCLFVHMMFVVFSRTFAQIVVGISMWDVSIRERMIRTSVTHAIVMIDPWNPRREHECNVFILLLLIKTEVKPRSFADIYTYINIEIYENFVLHCLLKLIMAGTTSQRISVVRIPRHVSNQIVVTNRQENQASNIHVQPIVAYDIEPEDEMPMSYNDEIPISYEQVHWIIWLFVVRKNCLLLTYF
jgi:hypothetical protein